MAGNGAYAAGTVLLHQVGSLSDSTGCIHHIVHQDNVSTLHVTDNLHVGNLVSLLTCLVAEHHRAVQILAVRAGTLGTAHVRCGNNQVFKVQALDVRQQNAAGIQVVNGNVEETLLLISVQVHCNQSVDTGYGKHVGYQLGGNAYTGLALTVLTCPAEVGHNRIDGTCGCTLGCVNHQQQLHQIVCIGECTLYQEYVNTTDTFLKTYLKLTVRELCYGQIAQFTTQVCADLLCQITALSA